MLNINCNQNQQKPENAQFSRHMTNFDILTINEID